MRLISLKYIRNAALTGLLAVSLGLLSLPQSHAGGWVSSGLKTSQKAPLLLAGGGGDDGVETHGKGGKGGKGGGRSGFPSGTSRLLAGGGDDGVETHGGNGGKGGGGKGGGRRSNA